MIESTRIEDIKERVRDLTQALRRGQAPEIAARIEEHAAGFIDIAQVRRSVAAIKQQLEHWRQHPEELPDMPIVHIAANRLEDACSDALRAGVIVPARPSLRTEGKRKITLAASVAAAGALMLFVPLVITMLGVDLTDPHIGREIGPLHVAQGDEITTHVNVLVESPEPSLTRGVEVYPVDRCESALAGGASCKSVEAHEWSTGKAPTFELMLQDQAYGLLFALTDANVLGQVGSATLRIAATDDTPEGTYRIALEGAFLGFTPAHCSFIERVRHKCEERLVSETARYDHLSVHSVIVQVVRADKTHKKDDAERRLADLKRKKQEAEERAKQLESAVAEIKIVLDDTQDMQRRKRYDDSRARIEKLAQLFSPLDSLSVDDDQGESLPIEVAKLRNRFESLSEDQKRLEERIFERAYAALNDARNKLRGEEALFAEVARREHVSVDYVAAIYTAHAEEIEKRLEAIRQQHVLAERAEREALEKRCGPLPTNAWKGVDEYLKDLVRGSKSKLGECLTPRLDAAHCWTVNCNFKVTTRTSDDVPDRVASFTKTFLLRNERVVGHLKEALP